MRKLVTIKTIDDIQPIENADRVVDAVIGGWHVVVPKNLYEVGERVFFFEIDSLIPKQAGFEYLFADSDKEEYHVKSQKLRGVMSQGIISKLSVRDIDTSDPDADYSGAFGVRKYEPPIKLASGGKQMPFPSFLEKTDEIRYQTLIADNDIDINPADWYATEKIDGTSTSCWCNDGEIGVAGRNWAFTEDKDNVYWNTLRKTTLKTALGAEISVLDWLMGIYTSIVNETHSEHVCVALQGETFGPRIQKNPLGMKEVSIRFFNMFLNGEQLLMSQIQERFPEILQLWVPIHPVELPEETEDKIALSNGRTTLVNDSGAQIEGLVWRNKYTNYVKTKIRKEPDWDNIPADKIELVKASLARPVRASFKIINNEYLLSRGE